MDSNLKQSLARLMAQYNTMHINGSGHDGRYYTKLQIDNFMSSIATTSALTDLKKALDDEVLRATSVETLKAPLNSPSFQGIPVATTASLGNSTQQLATTEFVQMSIDDKISNSDAVIIKGTLGSGGTVTELPSVYKVGWSYKIITAGTYAGQVCEVGDIITAFVGRDVGEVPDQSDWSISQTNIDGAITDIDNTDGYITLSKGKGTVIIGHKNISAKKSEFTNSLTFGGSFNVITNVDTDAKGHVVDISTTNLTLPTYTSLKNPYDLTIQGNGTTLTNGTYDGSVAKTVNITPSSIGAAASSHTHSYLPLSGGTLTGSVTFANGTYNTVGDDVAIGDINIGGVLGILGKNGNTAIQLVNYGATTTSGASVTGVRWTCTGNGTSTISGTTSGTFSGSLSGNATSASSCSGNSATATALTSSAGSSTKPVYFSGGKPVACSYTLGNACEKSYVDATSASAISSSSTSLMTQRSIYYGLPTINGSHSYTSSTNIYAPTSVGTNGYVLKSGGSGAPSWVAQSSLTAGAASKLSTARTLTIGGTGKTFDGSGNVSWSLSEIGAAPSSHSHSYIPLSGSTAITGALKWNSTNHGVYVSGSNLQIGDLSGSNGGFTQIMNDCQAKKDLTVYGTFNASTMSQSSYLRGKLGGGYLEASGSANYCVLMGSAYGYSSGGIKVTVYSTADGSIASTYGEITGTGDNTCNLGQYHTRWMNVYAASGTVNTSDRNLKDNIKPLDERYKKLLLALSPVSFTFKDGSSGRTHVGFISQDVEELMTELGMSSLDFAGFCKDAITEEIVNSDGVLTRVPKLDADGNIQYIYSLRYTEFIGIILAMVQDLYNEVEILKSDR